MGCLPPYELRGDQGALKAFYDRVESALKKWDSIINEPGRRAVVALKRGERSDSEREERSDENCDRRKERSDEALRIPGDTKRCK